MSLPDTVPAVDPLSVLSRFRIEFYDCLYTRADALFELTDAVLCADGPVKSLVELSLAAEHRRGHGAMYQALDRGWMEPHRLRRLLASLPLPRTGDGRITLAVDVSNWLRPDAPTSDQRLFCHVHGRGRNHDQVIPGWPYSFVAALERGRTSWCALLDAVRLGPADDATAVTAAQLRDVVTRIIDAGHWHTDDPDIAIVMDSTPRRSPCSAAFRHTDAGGNVRRTPCDPGAARSPFELCASRRSGGLAITQRRTADSHQRHPTR
jgi:hypothetical protein